MKTEVAKIENVKRDWYLVDAQDLVLGRLSSAVANILRGKNKAIYTPSVDTGDFVIVVNAEKIALTGHKLANKIYYNHSGYTGGLKEITPILSKGLSRGCFPRTSFPGICSRNSKSTLAAPIHTPPSAPKICHFNTLRRRTIWQQSVFTEQVSARAQ